MMNMESGDDGGPQGKKVSLRERVSVTVQHDNEVPNNANWNNLRTKLTR